VSEYRLLRRIFWPRMDQVSGKRRKLHNVATLLLLRHENVTSFTSQQYQSFYVTTNLSVLLVRATTLCGPLYGSSKARLMVSCRRKTCVESCMFLWMHVAGDACRVAGVGVIGSCGGGAA